MANTIGVRVYKIRVHQRRKAIPLLPLDSAELTISVPDFVSKFITSHNSVTQNTEMERSWYFETKNDDGPGVSRGYVHYGTYGFESKFIDTKTKKQNYRRQTTDIEEIPLFYEFWCPEKAKVGFVAFQSFQGRSCISLVMSRMKSLFEQQNPQHSFAISKLSPNDVKGSAYFSAPVKQLRLIKRKASSDIADRYFDNQSPEPIDFQIVISARRKHNLGLLGDLLSSVKSGEKSVVTHDGIDFPEAVAEIRVGGRTRRVGVFGFNSDAGVIDLTDAIIRGSDGHPTFESLKQEVNAILKDFSETLADTKA